MEEVSLKALIESGAHFGHQSKRWNPKMKPYLYGVKEGVHIFDLTKTKEKLEEAMNFLNTSAKEGKAIVFVGTKKQAKEKIREVGLSSDSFYINERWLGGLLTNFNQIQKSIKKLSEMQEKRDKGEYDSFTKKERLLLDREIERLKRFFGGIAKLTRIPDILVIVDIKKEIGAVREGVFNGLKIVGIVDSNSDPSEIDYPIPMNDDAVKALDYVLGLLGSAVADGRGKAVKAKEKEEKSKADKEKKAKEKEEKQEKAEAAKK